MTGTTDPPLLSMTFPLDAATLQLRLLPSFLSLSPAPTPRSHFLRSVPGPFRTSLYPFPATTLVSPLLSTVHAEGPRYTCQGFPSTYWQSQPLPQSLVPTPPGLHSDENVTDLAARPRVTYLISLHNFFPLMTAPSLQPLCWKAFLTLAPPSGRSEAPYILPRSSLSHPPAPSRSYWLLSKLSHSRGYVTLLPLQYNIERLQIPIQGFQDHTGQTGIYLLFLKGHAGRQQPVKHKSPGFWGLETRIEALVLPALKSSRFSLSFLFLYSPLHRLSRVQKSPAAFLPQGISESQEDPSGELDCRSCQALPDPVLLNPATVTVKGKETILT